MKNIKILFADDHSIVRNGLRALFQGIPGFSVVGEASDGEAAVQLAALRKPDIAVLDISMPKLNGIEATELIKARHPATKVLILTIHEDEAYVYRIIRAGANGYVVKNAEKKEIVTAVRTVAAGGPFFSPGISKLMVELFIRRAQKEHDHPSSSMSTLPMGGQEIRQDNAQRLTRKDILEHLNRNYTSDHKPL